MTSDIRQDIFKHIRENAKTKDVYIDFINGYSEHVHCLVSLNTEQTIAETMRLIKGESSFWINKNKLCKIKFGWQDEYYAVSVSRSGLNRVREYIKNQETHHEQKTFDQEVDEFVRIYGFERFKD
jgi:REP element-mobilizing transposase RayT